MNLNLTEDLPNNPYNNMNLLNSSFNSVKSQAYVNAMRAL